MRNLTITLVGVAALTFMGCGPSTRNRTQVIDSRAGTESEALTLTLDNTQGVREEAERAFVANGKIIAITSDVEVHELVVEVSQPVTGGYMSTWSQTSQFNGDAIAEVSSSGTVITFRSVNGGYINATTALKEEIQYSIQLDTRGLDGETVTLIVTKIGVKVGSDRTLKHLDVIGASTTFSVGESPPVTGNALQQSYSYGGRGANQEVASFELINGSTKHDVSVYQVFLVGNASGGNLRLTDTNGNLIATASDDGSGGYSFYVLPMTNANLEIHREGINRFKVVADTNAMSINGTTLLLQVSGIAVSSTSGVDRWVNNPLTPAGSPPSFVTGF